MTDNNLDPGFYSKTSCIQLMYGIWANMTSLAFGLAYGFTAIQLPQLVSPESNIKVTLEEESWIASVFTLFCPVGCLIGGYMMDKFGRRLPFWSSQIPMFLGWVYTGAAQNARSIIIGRALVGIGCGMGLGVPRLYTSEISLAKLRGVLGVFPNIFLSLGITLQAALGIFFNWQSLCYVASTFNIILFISYLFLSESPQYLLLHGSVHKARRVLARFRSKNYPVDTEMKALIEFKEKNDIRRLKFTEEALLWFSPAACKPFVISITYVAFTCLAGVPILTVWTINILMWANSSINVHAGYVLISITRLFFGILVSVLLFHVGRRPMAFISASGVGSSCLIMGLFLMYYSDPSIVPQILFMVYAAFATMGYQSLPFLLMTEMYPLQVRGKLIGISLTLTNVLIFLSTKYFPYLYESVGLPHSLFLFAVSSFLAFIFLYLTLPETKNLTLQEIEEYFSGVRRRPADTTAEVLERQLSETSQVSQISYYVAEPSSSMTSAAQSHPI